MSLYQRRWIKYNVVAFTRSLFRFFEKKEWAEEFVAGHVRVSTLSLWRGLEDNGQGDPDEALQMVVQHEDILMREGDTGTQERLRRFGISVGEQSSSLYRRNVIFHQRPDAYGISLTRMRIPQAFPFGPVCVEILDPIRVFVMIDKVMAQTYPLTDSYFGPVSYGRLEFLEGEQRPPLGLAKSPKFSYQHEARMLWVLRGPHAQLQPEFVEVPGMSALCRLRS